MKHWKKFILVLTVSGPTIINLSCSTIVGTAIRDAAIDGAAGFVEGTTAELLDRWFGATAPEE